MKIITIFKKGQIQHSNANTVFQCLKFLIVFIKTYIYVLYYVSIYYIYTYINFHHFIFYGPSTLLLRYSASSFYILEYICKSLCTAAMLAGVSLSSPYSGVSTAKKDRKNNFLSFFLQHYDITQNYRDA